MGRSTDPRPTGYPSEWGGSLGTTEAQVAIPVRSVRGLPGPPGFEAAQAATGAVRPAMTTGRSALRMTSRDTLLPKRRPREPSTTRRAPRMRANSTTRRAGAARELLAGGGHARSLSDREAVRQCTLPRAHLVVQATLVVRLSQGRGRSTGTYRKTSGAESSCARRIEARAAPTAARELSTATTIGAAPGYC
jgi:hypothetical protein